MRWHNVDRVLTDLVIAVVPWAAPFPTAWTIYNRTQQVLGWPAAVSFVAALVIEAMGAATIGFTLRLRSYNQTKLKTDPPAPTWLAAITIPIYFVTALTFAVVVELYSATLPYAPGLFIFLGMSGGLLLALRNDHKHRLEHNAIAKQERHEERVAARLARKQTQATPLLAGNLPGNMVQLSASKQRIIDALAVQPGASHSAIAVQLGITRQAVDQHVRQLEAAGLLSTNGHKNGKE